MPHPSDPRLSERLRAQLAHAHARKAAQAARLRQRTPGPAADDVYAVPLPVPGPAEWLVLGPSRDGRVELVAADRRPFADGTDLWLADGDQDLCLRLRARCSVAGTALPDDARVGVWQDAARGVQAHLRELDAAPEPEPDPDEMEWRFAVGRAARLLRGWLEDRHLVLTIGDLRAEAGAEAEWRSSANETRPAMAAEARSAREGIQRLARALAAGIRQEEIWCEQGRMSVVANPRGFGFLFEPSGEAAPPALRMSAAPDEPSPVHWDTDAGRSTWRAFLAHGWKTPGRAELSLRQPLSLELIDDQGWSRLDAT